MRLWLLVNRQRSLRASRPSPYTGRHAHRRPIHAADLVDRPLLSSDAVAAVRRDHWRLAATACQCAGGSRTATATATAPPLGGYARRRNERPILRVKGERQQQRSAPLPPCGGAALKTRPAQPSCAFFLSLGLLVRRWVGESAIGGGCQGRLRRPCGQTLDSRPRLRARREGKGEFFLFFAPRLSV